MNTLAMVSIIRSGANMAVNRRRFSFIRTLAESLSLLQNRSPRRRSLSPHWAKRPPLLVEELEDRTVLAPTTWTLVGPQPQINANITVTNLPNETVSGRVTSLAVLYNDNGPVTADAVIAGTAGGGLWLTTDLGPNGVGLAATPNWYPVGDNLYTDDTYLTRIAPANAPPGVESIGSIATEDPAWLTPNSHAVQVVYAGTGEANFNSDAIPGVGILKSIDGGLQWFIVATGETPGLDEFVGQAVSKIIVTPNGTVFAAVDPTGFNPVNADDGVYEITDGGQT
jgi:hypothetical protein